MPLKPLAGQNIQAALIRIDPRISQDVWRTALQFMYTNVVHCNFTHDVNLMVELLHACLQYKLPKAIQEFTQAHLMRFVSDAPLQTVMHVFELISESPLDDATLRPLRDMTLLLLLQGGHMIFPEIDARKACMIMQNMVQAVEFSVFNPSTQSLDMSHSSVQHAHWKPQDMLSQSVQSVGSSSRSVQNVDSLSHSNQFVDLLSQSAYNGIPQQSPQYVI